VTAAEQSASATGTLEVTATAIVNAPAAEVFDAFVAWDRQSEWIPFTKVRVVEGDGGAGSVIEAVTTVGPATLVDVMRVEKLDPPYQVKVLHTGRILRGPGVMRVTPMGPNRTQMVWHEWLQLPGGALGRVAGPVLWPGSKASLTQALRRFARLVEAGKLR
jgi:Polyketide cyclase / dehydrase and lipid transport